MHQRSQNKITARDKSRDNNFDFIRFFAAVLVLFSHSYPLSGRDAQEPFLRITGYETGGGIAVSIFFIISGYLITASYINGRGSIDYLKKRFFRIFPGLAVAVLLSIVWGAILTPLGFMQYVTHPQTIAYLKNLALNIQYNLPLVFANNIYPHAVNGSLWTLPIEAFMYAIVLFFGIINCLKKPATLLLAISFSIFYFFAGNKLAINNYIVLGAAPLILLFKLGALFFFGSTFYLLRERIPLNGYLALLFLIAIILTLKSSLGLVLYILLAPYLIFYISHLKIPHLSKFGKYGDFSYGIYIYAFPVQQSVIYFLGSDISIISFVSISFLITIVLAVLSWKLVEGPALTYVRNATRSKSAHVTQ